MATKQINQYTAAISIDAANDQFLIDPGGTGSYKKINRNTIMGVSGTPADLSSTQTFTNKVMDNTNTITLKDTLFTLQDDGDVTKQVKFQLSGITTGNTRTLTVPNASVTLASLTGTETLTNKTITSPAITGGTYDNGTITVDSISGHTTAGTVTVGGVQFVSGVLNTANSVTATSIAASAVQPQALQSGTGSGWALTGYTPTWTNVTTTTSTQNSAYVQIGKMVYVRIFFKLGASSAIGTNPQFTLPVTGNSIYTTVQSGYANVCTIRAAGTNYMGLLELLSTTTVQIDTISCAGTSPAQASVTSSVPNTWTTGDWIYAEFWYEAA